MPFRLHLRKLENLDELPIAIRRLADGWSRTVVRRMHSHLINLEEEAEGADLVMSIVNFEMKTGSFLWRNYCERTLAVHIAGKFSHSKVEFELKRTRSLDLHRLSPRSQMASEFTGVGKPALQFVVQEIARKPDGDCKMPIEEIDNEPFFAEYNLNLIEEFDKQTGRDQDLFVTRWKALQWLSTAVTALTMVTVTAWVYYDEQRHRANGNGFATGLIGGLMIAAPVWLLLYSATASSMPVEFFVRHATGQRIVKFVGCQNPAAARPILKIATFGLIAIGAFLWYVSRSAFNH